MGSALSKRRVLNLAATVGVAAAGAIAAATVGVAVAELGDRHRRAAAAREAKAAAREAKAAAAARVAEDAARAEQARISEEPHQPREADDSSVEAQVTRAVGRLDQLKQTAMVEDRREQEVTAQELRRFRELVAEDSSELSRIPTTAMRTIWEAAGSAPDGAAARPEQTPREREWTREKLVRRRMREWVVQRGGLVPCEVCGDDATSPPDVGITCIAGHFTCRECFCQDITLGSTCAPGGRADVETDGKPRGAYACIHDGCDAVLSELQVIKQISDDEQAFHQYRVMIARHAVERHEDEMRQARAAQQQQDADNHVAAAERVVALALTLGGFVRCPYCTVGRIKDNACMHMDSCPCRGGRFCYACGGTQSECRNGSGCDSRSIYLENHPGYGGDGETALQEFHHRRTKAILQLAKQLLDRDDWDRLRQHRPQMLLGIDVAGRIVDLDWDDTAAPEDLLPTFGGSDEHRAMRVSAQLAAAQEELERELPATTQTSDRNRTMCQKANRAVLPFARWLRRFKTHLVAASVVFFALAAYIAYNVPCTVGQSLIDTGLLSDGQGNYGNNADCRWFLSCSNPVARPLLTFSAFQTERVHDVVYVRDGVNTSAPLLARLSGDELPRSQMASGSAMLVQLTTDSSVVKNGFEANFSCMNVGEVSSDVLASSPTSHESSEHGEQPLRSDLQVGEQLTNQVHEVLQSTFTSLESGWANLVASTPTAFDVPCTSVGQWSLIDTGLLSDGIGDYSNNADCRWFLSCSNPVARPL
eukprot:SAG31_NODE_5772_length_2334_cov_1.884116_1_plen_761_part_01